MRRIHVAVRRLLRADTLGDGDRIADLYILEIVVRPRHDHFARGIRPFPFDEGERVQVAAFGIRRRICILL